MAAVLGNHQRRCRREVLVDAFVPNGVQLWGPILLYYLESVRATILSGIGAFSLSWWCPSGVPVVWCLGSVSWAGVTCPSVSRRCAADLAFSVISVISGRFAGAPTMSPWCQFPSQQCRAECRLVCRWCNFFPIAGVSLVFWPLWWCRGTVRVVVSLLLGGLMKLTWSAPVSQFMFWLVRLVCCAGGVLAVGRSQSFRWRCANVPRALLVCRQPAL